MPGSLAGIVLVLIIILTTVAGCTQSTPAAPPVTTLQVTEISTPHTPQITAPVIPAPISVTTGQGITTANPVKIFNGEYHWAEYRENNSVTMPPNPRSSWIYNHKIERSTGNYQGRPAVHYTITTISDYPYLADNVVTITKDGSVFVDDAYYDVSTGRYLGGTLSSTIKGVVQPSETYPHDNSENNSQFTSGAGPGGWMGLSPFGEMTMTFTDQGTESVTLPSGTYYVLGYPGSSCTAKV
jgi:hypothetical protein